MTEAEMRAVDRILDDERIVELEKFAATPRVFGDALERLEEPRDDAP